MHDPTRSTLLSEKKQRWWWGRGVEGKSGCMGRPGGIREPAKRGSGQKWGRWKCRQRALVPWSPRPVRAHCACVEEAVVGTLCRAAGVPLPDAFAQDTDSRMTSPPSYPTSSSSHMHMHTTQTHFPTTPLQMDERRIGVLGGGQLGRMMAEAGHRLGIHLNILDPGTSSCVDLSA